jgi:hypothetical protein
VSQRTASPPISMPVPQPSTTHPRKEPWLTAEEEKVRIYEQAQATAKRTQSTAHGYSYSPPTSPTQYSLKSSPSLTASGSHAKSTGKSTGAALYQQAISSMNRNAAEQTLPSPSPSRGRSTPPVKSSVPVFPSAEEEKAALKRYHEAKNAVDRTQGMHAPQSPPLIPYDALYPNDSRSAAGKQSSNPLSEKEKLRRAYEAQDAAASSIQSPPAPDYDSPPSARSALMEKEILRRKFEAQDASDLAYVNGGPAPQPPPRKASVPQPSTPPPIAGSSRILSAVEEKARLKAKYDAEERQNSAANGSTSPPPSFGQLSVKRSADILMPPAPPPLMPRPPAEYIQETQEEDARVRSASGHDHPGIYPIARSDLRPFAPFTAATNGMSGFPGPPPPPPLPPKQFSD